MKKWLLPSVLFLMIAAAHHWRDLLRGQLLGQGPWIPAADVQRELAWQKFRHGASGDAKQTAIQAALNKELVRRQRLMDPSFQANVSEAQTAEMQAWRRQWEKDAERQTRLTGQSLTEGQMEPSIREALLDQAWIEQQIAQDVSINTAELKAAYKSQRQLLALPKTYHVAHLFLSHQGAKGKDRRAELSLIHQKLLEGTSWGTLVTNHSEDARTKLRQGDLGWMGIDRMPIDFMAAVQQLSPGETSGPIRTQLGWHLLRLLEKRPTRPLTFEEAAPELKTRLVQQKRELALERLVQRLLKSHPGARF